MVDIEYPPDPRWTTTDGADSRLLFQQSLILCEANSVERLEVGVSDVSSLRCWSHVPQPVTADGSGPSTFGSPLRAFFPCPPVGPVLGLPLTLALVHAIVTGLSAVSLVTPMRKRFVGFSSPHPRHFIEMTPRLSNCHGTPEPSLSRKLNVCSPSSTGPRAIASPIGAAATAGPWWRGGRTRPTDGASGRTTSQARPAAADLQG